MVIAVRGVVQGVGFRPFVHRLALACGLDGSVRNEAGEVTVLVEGDGAAIDAFVRRLRDDAPPLARVHAVRTRTVPPADRCGFTIEPSAAGRRRRQPVAPDAALCSACAAEVADPDDRRFRYPFTTCTDCGPRFTVIEAMPFDRERTSLRRFPMCPACAAEYHDPASRRFHCETIACPDCGPRVWFEGAVDGNPVRDREAIVRATELLRAGGILAVRGLGGFHLAVRAANEEAVVRLRSRKAREAKPLAVMVRTLEEAERLGVLNPVRRALLMGASRPIVLLPKQARHGLAEAVSPELESVGVMLAYTPLHHLLLEDAGGPLVMTSGNASDEPIAIGNDEARRRLGAIADGMLLHDREIVSRYDDSVVRDVDGAVVFLRRARGYAPLPLELPVPALRPLVAVGPHLKNTLTLAAGREAFVSQHIGDLENLETLDHFESALDRLRRLFRIDPEIAVCDRHPGYLSTRIAREMGCDRVLTVQHHHAHMAAVAAEYGVTDPIVGIALDGTGYGDDGRIWGGEILVGDLAASERAGRLRYAPLPGGDLAAREGWRAALAYTSLSPDLERDCGSAFDGVPPSALAAARGQIASGVNAPLASSTGRLFDAAAAIMGVRRRSAYEGQAAMMLESLASVVPGDDVPIPVRRDGHGVRVLDPLPLLAHLGRGTRAGVDPARLAATFHDSLAGAFAVAAAEVARERGIGRVALGGGVFQNARLLSTVRGELESRGLDVLVPRRLSPNDGAISYGQAAVAAARLHRDGRE